MPEQKVTLVVANREYPLTAETPEMENLMRRAAGEVNGMLDKFNERYPETQLVDKLVFAALQQAAMRLDMQDTRKELEDEVSSLEKDLERYLRDR